MYIPSQLLLFPPQEVPCWLVYIAGWWLLPLNPRDLQYSLYYISKNSLKAWNLTQRPHQRGAFFLVWESSTWEIEQWWMFPSTSYLCWSFQTYYGFPSKFQKRKKRIMEMEIFNDSLECISNWKGKILKSQKSCPPPPHIICNTWGSIMEGGLWAQCAVIVRYQTTNEGSLASFHIPPSFNISLSPPSWTISKRMWTNVYGRLRLTWAIAPTWC